MDRVLQLRRYLYYLLFAHDEHQIHSPFIFDLYINTIVKPDPHPAFSEIENLRKELQRNKARIKVTDYGSGSSINHNKERSIRSIALNSLKRRKYSELLYRLAKHYKPEIALELGTSLGISSLYQSLPLNHSSNLYTLEGCSETLKVAKANFQKLKKNIKIIEGNIDNTLPTLLNTLKKVDYVFFDANHTLEATISYYEQCLDKAHENTIFIFDDIHHSKEMDKAWIFIKAHKQVKLTIDLFEMGLVFFRTNQPKQHFLLQF